MPGATWTIEGEDHEWMVQHLPRYTAVYQQGKACKKNPKRDAFIESVYHDYEAAFPGRMASWILSKIGIGGSDAERKEKSIQVSYFFQHWGGNTSLTRCTSDLTTGFLTV